MAEYSKYNIVYRLQRWMDSVPGQTFLNYAYSWGASLVILGALFKLTHLTGGNLMLFVGMGTEVIVFFLSAFDRPFDKTADGRNIPTHITDEYLETGKVSYDTYNEDETQPDQTNVAFPNNGGTATITHQQAHSNLVQPDVETPQNIEQQQSNANELVEAQSKYIEELQQLTQTLSKVSEQSMRLTRDSEEMENLNRTLTSICKVYEMQLKGASKQIGTIDQINDQSHKMAQQIEELNKIYARMIAAMTVNIPTIQTKSE